MPISWHSFESSFPIGQTKTSSLPSKKPVAIWSCQSVASAKVSGVMSFERPKVLLLTSGKCRCRGQAMPSNFPLSSQRNRRRRRRAQRPRHPPFKALFPLLQVRREERLLLLEEEEAETQA